MRGAWRSDEWRVSTGSETRDASRVDSGAAECIRLHTPSSRMVSGELKQKWKKKRRRKRVKVQWTHLMTAIYPSAEVVSAAQWSAPCGVHCACLFACDRC